MLDNCLAGIMFVVILGNIDLALTLNLQKLDELICKQNKYFCRSLPFESIHQEMFSKISSGKSHW